MASRIRVLIADDHPLLREGVRRALEDEPGFEVVGEATDGQETVAKALQLCPDVVIMDVTMPRLNGLEATRQIQARNPAIKILGLTVHESHDYFFSLLEAGASGYLLKKDATADALMEAIQSVVVNGVYLHPTVAKWLVHDRLSKTKRGREMSGQSITPRETEILKLVADGYSNHEIGNMLSLSPITVQTHRSNILQKLGLHSRADLVKYAIGAGLIHVAPRE